MLSGIARRATRSSRWSRSIPNRRSNAVERTSRTQIREIRVQPRKRSSSPPTRILPQARNIPSRRTSEEAAVFPAELGGAQISNALTRAASIHHRPEHEAPSFLEPQHFLILQRAHRGHSFEVF